MATGNCEVCGRFAAIVELPGRTDKYCAICAADVLTVILLHTEIEVARRGGRDPTDLESEAAELLSKLFLKSGVADS